MNQSVSQNKSGINVSFERTIPLRYDVDILVVGGGPSGVAAAVTASRKGYQVLLLEGTGCFGGLGTSGLVPAFMQFTDSEHFLAGGIGREVCDRLDLQGGFAPQPTAGYKVEVLKRVFDDMVVESGAAHLLQTQMIAVELESERVGTADGNGSARGVGAALAGDADGGARAGDGASRVGGEVKRRVAHIICSAKSGLFAARAKIYIDCTGDGDLAAWAGNPYWKGDGDGAMMAGTLCSIWSNLDWDEIAQCGISAQEEISRAIDDGSFKINDRHLPGVWRIGHDVGGGNIGHVFGVDGTDEVSLTDAFVRGRRLLLEYERFYKSRMPGYSRMELVQTGSLMGIRETRRIMGDYVLNIDDFVNRASFNDEIGRYSYPIDIHSSTDTDEGFEAFSTSHNTFRYGRGESYGIPYRCLLPSALVNVLVAGRCISSDRYIQSSIRVMPGCFITGQAAGMAASLSVASGRSDSRGIDTEVLRTSLREIGAFLP